MNTLLHRLSAMLAVLVITAAALTAMPAQAKSASRSVTSRISRSGAKPAVKMGRSDINMHPKARSGAKKRSGDLHVDNHTQYFVDIYVDGDYSGTVEPYGDLYIYEPYDDVTVSGDVPGTDLYYSGNDISVPGIWSLY